MMKRLGLASMRWQIFLLAVLPLVLFVIFALVAGPLMDVRQERREWASVMAGKILVVTDLVRNSPSPDRMREMLLAAARSDLTIRVTANAQAETPIDLLAGQSGETADVLVDRLMTIARDAAGRSGPEQSANAVMVKIDENLVLTFMPKVPAGLSLDPQMIVTDLAKIALFVVPLMIFAYFMSRWITEPLSRFAAAAGRISENETSGETFVAEGAAEIRSLGQSLNVMRGHIDRMIERQKQLIKSVGHDLRTPLTRLRMRTERCPDPDLRRMMLVDISMMSAMIDECVAYLTNSRGAVEASRRIDLSSLLQTITSDYADIGITVPFSGPRRLIRTCMPRGIIRAVSNLIDNASRYGDRVELFLGQSKAGDVLIDVRDNGPGLSDELKKKVMEPFFKADIARTMSERSGMGLGLSIASGIIRYHGGTLTLLDRKPNGLIARITLPAERPAEYADVSGK